RPVPRPATSSVLFAKTLYNYTANKDHGPAFSVEPLLQADAKFASISGSALLLLPLFTGSVCGINIPSTLKSPTKDIPPGILSSLAAVFIVSFSVNFYMHQFLAEWIHSSSVEEKVLFYKILGERVFLPACIYLALKLSLLLLHKQFMEECAMNKGAGAFLM
ncbi:unnamed protein product, partial [Gongylonema pulchrum]|uniref:S4A7 n=1 Tax=Gongylonema pulchrum TaxID=637853 RepID=A0A183DAF3_9BILA